MDFRNSVGQTTYGVRVSALIIQDGSLLTARLGEQYTLIGGAIHVGESSEDGMRREVMEELGVTCNVGALAFLVENHFTEASTTYHTIELHYVVDIKGDLPEFLLDADTYAVEWLPLNQLSAYDLRPHFLAKELLEWDGHIKQIRQE